VTDGDTAVSQKCCYDGCDTRTPTDAVLTQCAVTGYRRTDCLNSDLVDVKYPDGALLVPPGDKLPELCYFCPDVGICAYDKLRSVCDWDNQFRECINKCTTPTTTPVIDLCSARGPCQCFGSSTDIDPCTWCQYTESYTREGVTTTETFGRCMTTSLSNKCGSSFTNGGYSGSLIVTKPTDCDSTSASQNTIDPAAAIKDERIALIVKEVIDGKTSSSDLQIALNDNDVKDIIVKEIRTSYSDGDKGVVVVAIEVVPDSTTGTVRPDEEIKRDYEKACIVVFNMDPALVRIEKTELAVAVSGKKRATSTQYLATSTIQTAPPPVPGSMPSTDGSDPTNGIKDNSGFSLTPLWLFALLLIFPFLR
jgi:hypothetical protein